MQPVASPMQGTVVSIDVAEGDVVRVGQQLVVLESMKMEHVVAAEWSGVVTAIPIAVGDTVMPGDALVLVEAGRRRDAAPTTRSTRRSISTHVRADLAEVIERHDIGLDHRRPDAVARRRATGQRTARENVADLVDDGSFVEYAPLVVAAQRRRRSLAGADRAHAGRRSGRRHRHGRRPARRSRCRTTTRCSPARRACGTTQKKDRLFELAERMRLPVVFFTEGGGGRPGDTDGSGVSGSTASRSTTSRGSAGWCRSSASRRATASPATRRCSAAAT